MFEPCALPRWASIDADGRRLRALRLDGGAAILQDVRDDVERADLPQPAPTEREAHQLAARAAALEEIAVLYRAVHAQRAAYAPDSETYRALSRVLELLRARRGDPGGQPS